MIPVGPTDADASNDATPQMAQLAALRCEHQQLNLEIDLITDNPASDQLHLRRLKKRKLRLKDAIALLESEIIPDLNA